MIKNKKQILTTLLSVLLPVFLVSAVAYATTIGNDVTVGNDLTVTGALIANGNVTLGNAAGDTLTVWAPLVWAATTTTFGIDLDAATFSTADIRLQNGGTISNVAAGTIDFGATNLKTTGTLSGLTKITINNLTSTAGALKIHSHQMASTTDDSPNQYANEFKGEFLGTSGTMDGIAAHYHMATTTDVTRTGVMRSILGVAYLDSGVILSGTEGTGSWISGILGLVNVAGTVNGTAVTVTGVYGGLGSMTGGTLTEVNDMSAMWADSQATQVPGTGDSQLLLMTNSGTGGTVGQLKQAIKIDAGNKITNFIRFDNAGAMISDTAASGAAKKIKILIGDTTYYINAYLP